MILLFIIIFITSLLFQILHSENQNYTCGADESPSFRAVGITKDKGFKGGQVVKLAFIGDVDKAKYVLDVLKNHAFPFINLKFQVGRTGDSVVTIKTNSTEGPTANISGNTTGIGTKTPVISLYKLNQGVILHEFGHAMGMYHEHQNPAPNNPIVWDKSQVYAYYVDKQHWKKENVDSQIINRRDKAKSMYTPWDPNSIMNYTIRTGLTEAPVQTFLGQDYSDGDKAWFKLKYG